MSNSNFEPPAQPIDYNGFQPAEVRGYGIHPTEQPYPPIPAPRAEAPSKPVKQARDRAQYVRQQKGHSWLLHWIVLGVFTMWIVPVYYSFSPNHYWHI